MLYRFGRVASSLTIKVSNGYSTTKFSWVWNIYIGSIEASEFRHNEEKCLGANFVAFTSLSVHEVLHKYWNDVFANGCAPEDKD